MSTDFDMADKPRQKRKVAITNVRVFDGESFGEPTTVMIDEGIISQHTSNAKAVDGQGGFLLPGFIDAHIHLNGERELRMMVEHGVTTGLDMATWPPSKIDALRHFTKEGLTDFRTPGVPATSPGSLHSIMLPIPDEALLRGPEDAPSFVENRLKEGVDYIKMIVDVPGPDLEILKGIVREAHKNKKLVVAHASAYHTFAMAQDAGSDIITHVPRDKTLDQEACLRLTRENRISVPTLAMMEAVTKPMGWTSYLQMLLRPRIFFAVTKVKRKNTTSTGEQSYENARDSVKALHRAGVPILAGTDCHEEPTSPFSVKHSDSLHRELELLVEAGLSTVEALQAATSLPAKYFSLPDRGSIEVGKRADLVLLSENPITNIKATRSIRKVWCAGFEVDIPSTFAAKSQQPVH